MARFVRIVSVVVLAGFFSACGGGGGHSGESSPPVDPVTYQGNTAQATITASNAKRFFDLVFGATGRSSAAIRSVVFTPISRSDHTSELPRLGARLRDELNQTVDQLIAGGSHPTGAKVITSATCAGGGSRNSTGFVDDHTRLSDFTTHYVNCADSQNVVLNGDAVFHVRAILSASNPIATDVLIEIPLLRLADTVDDVSVSGSMVVMSDPASGVEVETINVVVRDSDTGRLSKTENLVRSVHGPNLTISGRVFDSVDGFVDILVGNSLLLGNGIAGVPSGGGPLTISGDTQTSLIVTPLSSSSAQLDLATAGVIELTAVTGWDSPEAPTFEPPPPPPVPTPNPPPAPPDPEPAPIPVPEPPPAPPPPNPVPDPQPATISETNIDAFVQQVVFALMIGRASQAVTQYSFQATLPGTLAISQRGCIGGEATYVIDTTTTPPAGTGGSYVGYDNCAGLVVDGSVGVHGTYIFGHVIEEDFVSVDLDFSRLGYMRKSDGAMFRLAGTIKLNKNPAIIALGSDTGYIATINASLFDASDVLVSTMENFVINSARRSPGTGSERITFSGRVFDPAFGFIDVISPSPVSIPVPGTEPSTGGFIIQGENQQAVIVFAGGAHTTTFEPIQATDIALDPDFGADGRVTTDFNDGIDFISSIVQQPDGKFIAAGGTNSSSNSIFAPSFALARYNIDGSLDTTFGGTGKVNTGVGGGVALSLVLQPDGKLVAAGSNGSGGGRHDFVLVRHNQDGSLDQNFGSNGKTTTAIDSLRSADAVKVLLLPDGKLVVAGVYFDGVLWNYVLVRYNTDGDVDRTFGSSGVVLTPISHDAASLRDAALQPDGKIVVGGDAASTSNGLLTTVAKFVRYNSDGSMDLNFGTNGTVEAFESSFTQERGLLLQVDGGLLAAAVTNDGVTTAFVLSRFRPDGSIDTTFGVDGVKELDPSALTSITITMQPDGKLLMAGSRSYGANTVFTLSRFLADGELDGNFGSNGTILTAFAGVDASATVLLVQSDGKLVAAGSAGQDFALARYLP